MRDDKEFFVNADDLFIDNNMLSGSLATTTTIHNLNINKVKTLQDVINVIDGLCISIELLEGTTSELYEKLKEYMD